MLLKEKMAVLENFEVQPFFIEHWFSSLLNT